MCVYVHVYVHDHKCRCMYPGVCLCGCVTSMHMHIFVCFCVFIHTTCPCYRLLGRKSWRRLNFQESCSFLKISLPSRQPLKDGCSTRQGLHSPLAPLITLQTSVRTSCTHCLPGLQGLHSPLAVPPRFPHAVYLTGFALPCTYLMV